MSQNQLDSDKTAKSLGVVLVVGAVALLGFVFYNYVLSGNLGYSSIIIAILLMITAMYPLGLGRNK